MILVDQIRVIAMAAAIAVIPCAPREGIVILGPFQRFIPGCAIMIHSRHECFMAEYCSIGELVPIHLSVMRPAFGPEHFFNRD